MNTRLLESWYIGTGPLTPIIKLKVAKKLNYQIQLLTKFTEPRIDKSL